MTIMNYKQVILVRTDLKMGKGKIAAQSSHASVEALEKTKKENPEWVEQWQIGGAAKVVLKVGSRKELLELFEELKKRFPTVLIKDAGLTQIKPGEPTTVGIGPVPENEIDEYTKELKLL